MPNDSAWPILRCCLARPSCPASHNPLGFGSTYIIRNTTSHRGLKSTSSAAVGVDDNASTGAPAEHTPPWSPELPHLPWQRKPKTKDIFVDDLYATLEAHRATNRAPMIRQVAPAHFSNFMRLRLSSPQASESRTQLPVQRVGYDAKDAQSSREPISLRQQLALDTQKLVKEKVPVAATNVVDYVGCYQATYGYWRIYDDSGLSKMERKPWLAHTKDFQGDGMSRLSDEIRAFETYMMLTDDERLSTEQCIDQVTDLINLSLPSNPLIIHGSRYTGLASPLSDIDFRVSIPEYENDHSARGPSSTRPKAQKASRKVLRTIGKILDKSSRYRDVELVWGSIPLITAIDNPTGLRLQFLALSSCLPAREYTGNYLNEYPSLRPLFILLRHILELRNLNIVFEGGLGSYPLLIMIVTALKHAPGTFAKDDLGGQLLHVLRFYADADLCKDGFSADPPRIFLKRATSKNPKDQNAETGDRYLAGIETLRRKSQHYYPWLLCLQDPADPVNDLGKKAYRIKHIQATFMVLREAMIRSMATWERENAATRESAIYSVLLHALGAKYRMFEYQRLKLAQAHKMSGRDIIETVERDKRAFRIRNR